MGESAHQVLIAADEAATMRVGAGLARALRTAAPQAGAIMIHLRGELGAGKTTFARGVARELGVTGVVRSPTYTLLECYPAGPVELVHLDLYRIGDPAELEDLGLREYDRPGCVWLVEWPERGGRWLGRADVTAAFAMADGGRRIHLEGHTACGRDLVALACETE